MGNYKNDVGETELFEDFEGLKIEGMLDYIKPKVKIQPINAEGLTKIKNRKISETVINDYKIGSNEKGEIVFPYLEMPMDEEPVRVKLKPTGDYLVRRDNDGNTKNVLEETIIGGKDVLFGSHLFETHGGSVPVLSFGEADAMTATECGYWGLSAPDGLKSDKFCKTQQDFLDNFKELVIAPNFSKDPATALFERNQLMRLIKKLGAGRLKVVKSEAMLGCKNLNELLFKHGKETVQNAIKGAGLVNDTTVYSIAEVKLTDEDLEGALSGWGKIDEMLGGFIPGGLTIIGGNTENGKTTAVLNLLAALISSINCWYWSGEETDKQIYRGLQRVLSGKLGLEEKVFDSGKSFHLLKEEYEAPIAEYLRKRLFLFDDSKLEKKPSAAIFFRKAEFAIQRYRVKAVFFDNLMAFTGGTGAAYFQAQADFAEECKRFAKRHNVHVFLVAHNRKFSSYELAQTDRGTNAPETDDIEGSSKITNWADNVLQVWRVPHKVKLVKEALADTDTVINPCKNRGSNKKQEVRFKYCIASRRIYELDDPKSQFRLYGWEPEELRLKAAQAANLIEDDFAEFSVTVTSKSEDADITDGLDDFDKVFLERERIKDIDSPMA